jgi:hypothetical protein
MSSSNQADVKLMRHWGVLGGVFLISLSLLVNELLLTRIFSVLFMYHFAFLVISLALFGLGISGIAVYLYPERFAGDLQRQLVVSTLGYCASVFLLVLFLFNLPLAPSGSLQGAIVISIVFLVSSVPFFLGGVCLSLILSRAAQEVNRLYFVDLLGAGIGCLLIIPTLNYFGGVNALLLTSFGGALTALLFSMPGRKMTAVAPDAGRLLQRTLTIIAVVMGLGFLFTLLAEPLANWVGGILFEAHPVYSKRDKPFSHYFDTLIAPEIREITSGTRVPLLVLFVAAAAGAWWARAKRQTAEGRGWLTREELKLTSVVVVIAVGSLVAVNTATDAIRIRFAKGRVEFQNLYEGWNSFSRIAVLPRHGDITYAWGLSPIYKGHPGDHMALDIDSLAGTPLVRFDGDINSPLIEHLSHDITALAYTLRPARTTLIIGTGGGRDVLTALKYGSKDIDAVELNPLMREVVNEKFGDFTGRLYARPEINFTIDDGRHFVRNTDKEYGLIQLSLVDTWASTAAGAFALSENTLYTTEAFYDYFHHLAPDGILTVSRWLSDPPRETLRVVSLARAALLDAGVTDAARHILVAGTPPLRRSHRFASVIVSRAPFTDAELTAAKAWLDERGFQILYFPGMPVDPLFSKIATEPWDQLQDFFANYEIDVSPTTDDRPFFFNTVRPGDFLKVWEDKPGRVGVHLLAQVLLIVLALVCLFMLGPLYLRNRSALTSVEPRARWSTLGYFAALGSGFMLVEVALISNFILFLGHPIYALTAVLCTLLISAGLGSLWSGKHVAGGHAALSRMISFALVGIVLLTLVLEFVFSRMVGAPFLLCILLTIATLGPVGFLMGMPFPLGLRLLDRVGPQWAALIPWVWGINGACSVLGSILAITLAINFGFRVTMAAGLVIYGIAWLTSHYLAGGEDGVGTEKEQAGLPPASLEA